MSFQGTMLNGVVVLDEPAKIPEGTRVKVVPSEPSPEKKESEPTLGFLLKYAGSIKDMPPDFAVQHDHYIHGTPKK